MWGKMTKKSITKGQLIASIALALFFISLITSIQGEPHKGDYLKYLETEMNAKQLNYTYQYCNPSFSELNEGLSLNFIDSKKTVANTRYFRKTTKKVKKPYKLNNPVFLPVTKTIVDVMSYEKEEYWSERGQYDSMCDIGTIIDTDVFTFRILNISAINNPNMTVPEKHNYTLTVCADSITEKEKGKYEIHTHQKSLVGENETEQVVWVPFHNQQPIGKCSIIKEVTQLKPAPYGKVEIYHEPIVKTKDKEFRYEKMTWINNTIDFKIQLNFSNAPDVTRLSMNLSKLISDGKLDSGGKCFLIANSTETGYLNWTYEDMHDSRIGINGTDNTTIWIESPSDTYTAYVYYGSTCTYTTTNNNTADTFSDYESFWTFRNSTTHWDLGGTSNATDTGSITKGFNYDLGYWGDFDSLAGQYMETHHHYSASGGITVEADVFYQTIDTDHRPWTVTQDLESDGSQGWTIRYDWEGSHMPTFVADSGSINVGDGGASLSTGQWYHIVGRFDNTNNNNTFFVNGTPVHSHTMAYDEAVGQNARIGASNRLGDSHGKQNDDAKIARVSITLGVVSDAEILRRAAGATIVRGAEQSAPGIDNKPTVGLVIPADNVIKTGSYSENFNATATDDNDVVNMTWALYNATGDLNDTVTKNFPGSSDTYGDHHVTKTIYPGIWTWKYWAFDNASQLKASGVRNIHVLDDEIYYYNVSLENNNIENDVTVLVNLSMKDLYNQGKIKADLSNVYFVDESDYNISYCINDYDVDNSGYGSFYINFSTLSNSTNTTIKMILGNVSSKNISCEKLTKKTSLINNSFTNRLVNITDDFNDGVVNRSIWYEQDPDNMDDSGSLNESLGYMIVCSGLEQDNSCFHMRDFVWSYIPNASSGFSMKYRTDAYLTGKGGSGGNIGFESNPPSGSTNLHAFKVWMPGGDGDDENVSLAYDGISKNLKYINATFPRWQNGTNDWYENHSYTYVFNGTNLIAYINDTLIGVHTVYKAEKTHMHTVAQSNSDHSDTMCWYHDYISLENAYTGWSPEYTMMLDSLKDGMGVPALIFDNNRMRIHDNGGSAPNVHVWMPYINSSRPYISFEIEELDDTNYELWLVEAKNWSKEQKDIPDQDDGFRIQVSGATVTYDFFSGGVETANQGTPVTPENVTMEIDASGNARIYENGVLKHVQPESMDTTKEYMLYMLCQGCEISIDDVEIYEMSETYDINESFGGSGLYIYGGVSDTIAPIVNLNSPATSSFDADGTVLTNCTVYDNVNVSNVTLMLNGVANGTNTSGQNNTAYTFNRTLGNGVYQWTCEACDTTGNCTQPPNRTFTVDTTNPAITINNPTNATISSDAFSFTIIDTNIVCGKYSVDGGSNITNCSLISGVAWSGTLSGLTDGHHNISVWANDSAGNTNTSIMYWSRDTSKLRVGVFSVGLFAIIMGAGFLLTIIKLLYVDNLTESQLINRIISIVIMALILGSALGIIFSL
jgi:hypothetical protein